MARSLENSESIERRLIYSVASQQSPVSSHSPLVVSRHSIVVRREHWEIAGNCVQGRGQIPASSVTSTTNDPRVLSNDLSIGWNGGRQNTVLPTIFDLVHRFVRGVEQFIRGGGDVGQRRHTDRRRQVNVE